MKVIRITNYPHEYHGRSGRKLEYPCPGSLIIGSDAKGTLVVCSYCKAGYRFHYVYRQSMKRPEV